MISISPANRIRELNDEMRRAGPSCGHWMMTQGVMAEGPTFMLLATSAVQTFSNFTPDNDPYGERDFGALDLAGQRMFWKIDCYDRDLRYGSNDPSNPSKTTRVLTIMLASEY
ncbi:MAG: DUF3768 domain-containing protein [Alphaproteobacteria bacterium]|nr:DUF3768 domain-containing protein [Alphaproteobacteria bacterium]